MLDISSAVPWLAIGFLAGLLAYFLVRAIFGSDKRAAAELENLTAQFDAAKQQFAALGKTYADELDAMRESSDTHASKAKYYENEYNSLSGHVAALGKTHAAELDALRVACHNEAHKAKHCEAEFNSLRDAQHALLRSNQAYIDDIARLKAELAAVHKDSLEVSGLKSEVDTLRAGVSRHLGEISDLKAEAAKLTEALESAKAREQSAALQYHATNNDLQQVRMGLEETSRMLAERHAEVDQLKFKIANMPDVEKYKRFKEALDAANLIVAGPPEKA